MPSNTSTIMRLAQGGWPLFKIHLPAGAPSPVEFAAEELRHHLHTMIGASARLHTGGRNLDGQGLSSIFINDWDATLAAGIDAPKLGLRQEDYHLESRGGNLYLLGGAPRGVLYSVYDLLESLGCRWFTPEISSIPRRRTITLPSLTKTVRPVFESRDTFNRECRDPLWWVRNRLNGWYTPVPEFMGGHVDYCGFVHTFYGLLPPEEFFASHPEYFSLVGGVRRSENAQLCLTNPEVLSIVTRRVLERMRDNPKATIFSVSQNDCDGYCECDACRAVAEAEGSQSGPVLRFVNAVAAETAKVFPDKLVDTLAYLYSLDAPRLTVPHPNVRVRLCSIRCCQGHPYGACDHPESQRFLHALDEWGKRTSQMYIWHYATNFSHYPLPMPDIDELHANLNCYHRYGVHGVFIQGMGEEGGGAESMALRGYVVSRLLWQPQQPVWPLVDEFLGAYYKKAAPKVREYLDIFHGRVRQDPTLHPSLYDPPSSRLLDADLRQPADTALAGAEELAKGKELQRVRLLRGGLRYARLYQACGTFQRVGDEYRGEATQADRTDFEDLVRLWQKAGVQRLREGEAFDFTVQKMRNRLSPHRVEWLREGEQRVAVVPSLGGRLLEWHALGRQWLASPDPDDPWQFYPMSKGYSEVAILGMYAFRGWGENYHVSRRGNSLLLWVEITPDLRFSRSLSLRQGKLLLVSQLKNRGTVPVSCGWGAALQLALPTPAQLSIHSQSGERTIDWERLPDGPGSALILAGEQLPAGEWQAVGLGFRVIQSFQGEPMARASLTRVEQTQTLALDLSSEIRLLEPGASLAVHQVIAIEALLNDH